VQGAGIKWFTTTFDLDIEKDLDVPIGVELGAPADTIARVLLFVNGYGEFPALSISMLTFGRYQYGKFLPHIGPQTRFPIPPGIMNLQGKNTLSVMIWAQTDAGAKLSTLELFEYARYESGFGFASIDGAALQPGWEDRSQYA
jgi:hypothetical protein